MRTLYCRNVKPSCYCITVLVLTVLVLIVRFRPDLVQNLMRMRSTARLGSVLLARNQLLAQRIPIILPKVEIGVVHGRTDHEDVDAMIWCGYAKAVAITLDDGPAIDGTTGMVLQEAKELGVPVTFYLSPGSFEFSANGTREQCDLVKRIIDEGHEIQLHSFTHKDFGKLYDNSLQVDLDLLLSWLQNCTERAARPPHSTQFRPPFGSLREGQAKYLNSRGIAIASWYVDSYDWKAHNASVALQNVLNNSISHSNVPSYGSKVVLMHDRHYIEGQAKGLLRLMVDHFTPLGFKFIHMSECYDICKQQGNCMAGQPVFGHAYW